MRGEDDGVAGLDGQHRLRGRAELGLRAGNERTDDADGFAQPANAEGLVFFDDADGALRVDIAQNAADLLEQLALLGLKRAHAGFLEAEGGDLIDGIGLDERPADLTGEHIHIFLRKAEGDLLCLVCAGDELLYIFLIGEFHR